MRYFNGTIEGAERRARHYLAEFKAPADVEYPVKFFSEDRELIRSCGVVRRDL